MKRNTPEPADPFENLEMIRLSQDYAADLGVQKMLLRVPVRRPHRQEFVRVRPGAGHYLDTALIETAEDHEHYLVLPGVRAALFDEIKPVRLFTTINRQGVVTLWPCRLPGPDGRTNAWHDSALEIAELAKTRWVRLAADRSLGAYQCYQAADDLPEPEWREHDLRGLLRIAFANGHLIGSEDHPVIRQLLGKV